jgi:hypothetical protein
VGYPSCGGEYRVRVVTSPYGFLGVVVPCVDLGG